MLVEGVHYPIFLSEDAGFSGPLWAWIKNPRQLIRPAGTRDVGPSGCPCPGPEGPGLAPGD